MERMSGRARFVTNQALTPAIHHPFAQKTGDKHERQVDPDTAGDRVSVGGE